MRVANDEASLQASVIQAQTEAKAAFGNGGVYLERFIDRPRHVEVQIIADKHGNVVHLGERDLFGATPSPKTRRGKSLSKPSRENSNGHLRSRRPTDPRRPLLQRGYR